MLKARDIMTREVISVRPQTGINQVVGILLDKHFHALPVVDQEDHLVGIICQDDLIVLQKKIPLPSVFTTLDAFIPLKNPDKEIQKMAATTAGEAMTPDPVTIGPDTTVEDIATLMVRENIHTLPVVEAGRMVGIVGKEDILRTLMPGTEG